MRTSGLSASGVNARLAPKYSKCYKVVASSLHSNEQPKAENDRVNTVRPFNYNQKLNIKKTAFIKQEFHRGQIGREDRERERERVQTSGLAACRSYQLSHDS